MPASATRTLTATPPPRRSQADRRAQTASQLLAAAAELVAERGIDGVSVDAVAERAGRTSGAVYARFGSKHALLLALVDEWMRGTATVVRAARATGDAADDHDHDPRDADQHDHTWGDALWEGFAAHVDGEGAPWMLLEHELLLRAARDESFRGPLAARYADVRARLAEATGSEQQATLVVALLLGLDLQRRLDPGSVPDELARAGLAAVLDAAPTPPRSGDRRARRSAP